MVMMFFFLKMQAWVNEKFAPELLESKADLVECMLDQIKEMASSNYYYAQKELFDVCELLLNFVLCKILTADWLVEVS